ncbi:DUF427 domain-containing protein [Paraburkholderia fungorum]|jgi:uncharacterized protein (DUF427 family)|uniref:DUF427 domain-containing protein n=1 Tax=Paraburkholderia fungorum TaxID=134537 RepID=UPI0038B79F15
MLQPTYYFIDVIRQGVARVSPHRIVVRLAGRVIADTRAAYAIEQRSDSGYLIPSEDVDMHFLRPSDGIDMPAQISSKRWFDFECGSTKILRVAWQDSFATDAMGVGRYLAFGARRVDTIERQPLTTLLQLR